MWSREGIRNEQQGRGGLAETWVRRIRGGGGDGEVLRYLLLPTLLLALLPQSMYAFSLRKGISTLYDLGHLGVERLPQLVLDI